MDIFPAIDLQDGCCVRLTKGDFNTATIYESDPLRMAAVFKGAGAEWLHIVDLNGARKGEMVQDDLVLKLARHSGLKTQVGGGVRSEKTVERLLEAGVSRVVIGSLAVKNRKLVQNWLTKFGPDRLTLAFDIKFTDSEPEILTHGWQAGSQQLLWDVLEAYDGSGLKNILVTDVSRDGMMVGTNHGLYRAIYERWPKLAVLASGGVNDLNDLIELAKLGLSGAIVGKALYEGRVNLTAALEIGKGRSDA